MISVMICATEPHLIECFTELLAGRPEFHIAELTDKPQAAIPAVLGLTPDLVICEDVAGLTVAELLRATAAYTPETWFLACNVPATVADSIELLRQGINDILSAGWTASEAAEALERFRQKRGSRLSDTLRADSQKLRRVLDKKFFEDLIVRNVNDAMLDRIDSVNYEYGLDFVPGWYQALNLLLDPRPREVLRADAFLPIIQVEALVREFFAGTDFTVVCYVQDAGLTALLNGSGDQPEWRGLCRRLLEQCGRELPWYKAQNTITIGVGLAAQRLSEISAVVQSAKFAGWMRLSEGKGIILEYEKYYHHYMSKEAFLPAPERSELLRSLKNLDTAACAGLITRSLQKTANAGEYMSAALSINDTLIEGFSQLQGITVVRYSKQLQHGENMPPMVECFDSYEQIRSAMIGWTSACIESIIAAQAGQQDTVITMARQYIAAHYTEPIHLEHVAEHVGLSATYFCMKFRQSTGKTFVEYLTEQRMERARELLLGTNRKIHEIATAVGFQDSRHFSRTFRKLYQVYPTEYREQGCEE